MRGGTLVVIPDGVFVPDGVDVYGDVTEIAMDRDRIASGSRVYREEWTLRATRLRHSDFYPMTEMEQAERIAVEDPGAAGW